MLFDSLALTPEEVSRQIEKMRAGVRIADEAIQELKLKRHVDLDAVVIRLESIRRTAEALVESSRVETTSQPHGNSASICSTVIVPEACRCRLVIF